MRRTVLFLSRFVLSLWGVLITGLLILLLSNAPNVPVSAPFAGISINAEDGASVYLPNRIFACAEIGQDFQCQTNLQGQSLDLILRKGSRYPYDLRNCRAQYNGRPVGCQEIGMTYAPSRSDLYEITDLQLNPQDLQAVQQQYRGLNTLKQLGERRLFQISAGLSLAAGISAVFFTWLHPGLLSRAFVSFASGFGIYHLVWQFLGRVQYDVVTPYGLTPDAWGWVVNGGAIAAGIGTAIATAMLLWHNLRGITKVLFSLISSVGILSLCWFSFDILIGFGLSPVKIFLSQYIGASGWLFITLGISIVCAIAAAVWLRLHTGQSIQRFLSLGSGWGTIAIAMYSFVYLLLGLGYAD